MLAPWATWEKYRTLRWTDPLHILPEPPTGWVTLYKSLNFSVSISCAVNSIFHGSLLCFVDMQLRSLKLLISFLGVQNNFFLNIFF